MILGKSMQGSIYRGSFYLKHPTIHALTVPYLVELNKNKRLVKEK